MKIILTDLNYVMDETRPLATQLRDKWGWWNGEGEIYIYTPPLTKIQTFGFVIHELFEYFLVGVLGANEDNPWPHRYACILEMVLTLGRAWPVLCWR